VVLQQIVQTVNVGDPQSRAAMDQLGEKLMRRRAELEQVLALEVAFGTRAGDRSDR
jgi:hypothetical protein